MLSLSDVIRRRHLLAPREAAALTLAIAHEWDRIRRQHGDVPLPRPEEIRLLPNGGIALPACSAGKISTPKGRASLSAVLSGLLGSDDESPSDDEALLTELPRFADADPRLLRTVYWRLAGGRRKTDRVDGVSAVTTAVARRRGPDRRRQSHTITELRREIRQLERQQFEVRQTMPDDARRDGTKSQETTAASATRGKRRMLWQAVVACAGIAIVAAVTSLRLERSDPRPPSPAPEMIPAAVQTATTVPHIDAPIARRETASPRVPPTRRVRARPPARPRSTSPTMHWTTVAGGTRGIVWLRNTP